MHLETRCGHCGARLRACIRAGPSGTTMVAGVTMRCPGCFRSGTLRVVDAPAPAPAVMEPLGPLTG